MALDKVTYVNGVTVITAQNMNDIQDAIIELENSGGSDDVYWVTPGVDSYADIVALQAQNKLLAISYDSRIYTLQYIENAYAWFCSFASGNFYYLKCVAQNSSWIASSATPYAKPSDGIPKTDLASGVQTSLGLADTAYQKPSGGIPASDLASAVRTSLSKADTALQFAPVSSVNGQTGAVSLTIPSTASDVGAVAANQGSGNAGKFLVVGNDGVVAPVALATWQGGSY